MTEEEHLNFDVVLQADLAHMAVILVPQYSRQPVYVSQDAITQPLPNPLPSQGQASTSTIPGTSSSKPEWHSLFPSMNSSGSQKKTPEAQKKTHARQTCQKCGKTTDSCNGSQHVSLCKNNCHDCNKPNCMGRDSKKPNYTCQNDGKQLIHKN